MIQTVMRLLRPKNICPLKRVLLLLYVRAGCSLKRMMDYDTLLQNISDLKAGLEVQVPIYDFKTSSRVGYRTLEAPSSRIVIVEGIYALSEKLRPLLDLEVSVTGGVHFGLVKRVLSDTHRAGNQPEEIIQQILKTVCSFCSSNCTYRKAGTGFSLHGVLTRFYLQVYPMYKAFIEPDLHTAHIKIVNKFNPFSGFRNPSYILKAIVCWLGPMSFDIAYQLLLTELITCVFMYNRLEQFQSTRCVEKDKIRAVLSEEHTEDEEQVDDIYLLPPGEDPESCQSYLRMRNRDGKYNLIFEEWVTDHPFIISPRITFDVSVRLLGGLMALGYTISAILKRSSHIFSDDRRL